MAYHVIVEPRRCKSCELCVTACPKKIMIISEQKNDLGFRIAACTDPSLCTGCAACAQICPDVAIEIFQEDAE